MKLINAAAKVPIWTMHQHMIDNCWICSAKNEVSILWVMKYNDKSKLKRSITTKLEEKFEAVYIKTGKTKAMLFMFVAVQL